MPNYKTLKMQFTGLVEAVVLVGDKEEKFLAGLVL